MDRILRTYAHSAWTPADPLAALDPEIRRKILLMPTTWRERWKVAPWTNRYQRRAAILDILAERRLRYDLEYQGLTKSPGAHPAPPPDAAPSDSLSPYYRYRLSAQEQAIGVMRQARSLQDAADIAAIPEARVDHAQREARRQALLDVNLERARLDLKELQIISGREDPAVPSFGKTKGKGKNKSKKQDYSRG